MHLVFLLSFVIILLPFSPLSAEKGNEDTAFFLPTTKVVPYIGKSDSNTLQTGEERIIAILADLFYFSKKILENAFQCRTLSSESCQIIRHDSNIENLLSQMAPDRKEQLLIEIQDFLKKHENLLSKTHSSLQGYSNHLKSANNPLRTWDHPFKQAAEKIIWTLRGFFPSQKGRGAPHQIDEHHSNQRHEVLDKMAEITKALFQEALKNQNHPASLEVLNENIALCYDLIKSIASSLDYLPLQPPFHPILTPTETGPLKHLE